MEQITRKNVIVAAIILTVLSFTLFCFVFSSIKPTDSPGNVATVDDNLSGETFNTEDVYNYREGNPYGSYLIGFAALTDHGVSDDEMTYIHDALINFTMYDEKIYNGRVSFVKDSYEDTSEEGDLYRRYDFKFGINDSKIRKVSVRSNWLDEKIEIKIFDEAGKEAFSRNFDILPEGYNS